MAGLESKSIAFLSSVQGVGQRTIALLYHAMRSTSNQIFTSTSPEENWKQFWVLPSESWQQIGVREKQIDSIKSKIKEQTLDSYFAYLEKLQIRVVLIHDAEYPPLLREVEQAPILLFAKGRLMNWETGPPIAVVGTRHMTEYGKQVTEKVTAELVMQGCPIISGAMYGVDICAHRTALHWEGQTVGVLGYGFEYVYPRSYRPQFEQFLAHGMTLISPFAPDVRPLKGNFPARNAIVAGMSAAVVVTEAAVQSGTMITAGFAADMGRPVCAVPGSIYSPYSQGTKELINQGATVITAGSEVLKQLATEST